MERRFYLVWSPTGREPPRFRHDTYISAVAEAQRLAGLHGGVFYVLAAASRCEKVNVRTEQLEGDWPDEIPF